MGDPKVFPGQLRDNVHLACPSTSTRPPWDGTYLEHLTREASLPESLYPLDVEELQVYTDLLLD